MKVIVAYDIGDNGRREAFAAFLKRHGLTRIQRSLFIGHATQALIKDIERYASRIIDKEKDCVHVFMLTSYEDTRIRIIGKPWNEVRETVHTAALI